MLRYKIDVADALERKGFNLYKDKKKKILRKERMKKIKREDINI